MLTVKVLNALVFYRSLVKQQVGWSIDGYSYKTKDGLKYLFKVILLYKGKDKISRLYMNIWKVLF